jgi:hypothetical protein
MPDRHSISLRSTNYREYQRLWRQKKRAQLLAEGRCTICGQLSPRQRNCEACRIKRRPQNREKARRAREWLVAAGLCVMCRKPNDNPSAMHCSVCNVYRCAVSRRCHRRRKLEVLKAYGGLRCACCGETELAFLSIDHMNGGGSKHFQALRNEGLNFYKWLKANGYPPGYQVLCFNCNHGRHINGGICPHQAAKVS